MPRPTKKKKARSNYLGIRVPRLMFDQIESGFAERHKGDPYYRRSDHIKGLLALGLELTIKTKFSSKNGITAK